MNDETKAAVEWLRKLRDDACGEWPPKHPTRRQRFLDVSPDRWSRASAYDATAEEPVETPDAFELSCARRANNTLALWVRADGSERAEVVLRSLTTVSVTGRGRGLPPSCVRWWA